MSSFNDFVFTTCDAEIECGCCCDTEAATGSSEREAEQELIQRITRRGWVMFNGKPCCPRCYAAAADARIQIEVEEWNAKTR
jgi:hypothetical protein